MEPIDDQRSQYAMNKMIDDSFSKFIYDINEAEKEKTDEPALDQLKKELREAYYNHLKWRFKYPEKTFGRQRVFSILITVVVFLLIISGLIFSFYQLKIALAAGNFDSLNTSIAFEAAGKVTVKSSVVGAIVLVISLAFFYLYLVNVYRIKYTQPPLVNLSEVENKVNEELEKFKKDIKKSIGG